EAGRPHSRCEQLRRRARCRLHQRSWRGIGADCGNLFDVVAYDRRADRPFLRIRSRLLNIAFPDAMSGRAEILAGTKAETAGDFVEAAAAYRAALTSTDDAVVADAQFHLGRVAWRQGQLALARDCFGAARDAALRLGDDEARARAENGLGLVHYARGE